MTVALQPVVATVSPPSSSPSSPLLLPAAGRQRVINASFYRPFGLSLSQLDALQSIFSSLLHLFIAPTFISRFRVQQ